MALAGCTYNIQSYQSRKQRMKKTTAVYFSYTFDLIQMVLNAGLLFLQLQLCVNKYDSENIDKL